MNYLKKFIVLIFLAEKGKNFSSSEFSDFIGDERSHFIFVMAGALGWSDRVKEIIKINLSLSKMTFPHEMAKVILLEQIYRSVTILKNKAYHY